MPFDFDPYDSTVMDDPYPAYRFLQENDPVHYSHALRSWILTHYDDVRPSLNDPRLSADRISPYLDRLSEDDRDKVATVGPMLQKWAVFMDPPDHADAEAVESRIHIDRDSGFPSQGRNHRRADD